MTSSVVTGPDRDDSVLVAIYVDLTKNPGPEGFVRVDEYVVCRPSGEGQWQSAGKRTLTRAEGGEVDKRCIIGVCASAPERPFSATVSFVRAPGSPPGTPHSPFADPNPREYPALKSTHTMTAPDGKPGYFYPILAAGSPGLAGEQFLHGGNYFYTVHLKDMATNQVFVCDPEMEIWPL